MISIAALTLLAALEPTAPKADPMPVIRQEAARQLQEWLGEPSRSAPDGARLTRLTQVGRDVADQLVGQRASRLLREAVSDARWLAISDAREGADQLRDRMASIASDLAFEPIVEADLPAGLPAPTPVLEIELKRYPAYRVATASDGRGRGAFWTLFRHIKKHGIPMTAPVESTYDDELSAVKMGFLYQSPEVGTAGRDGRVEVIDIDTQWVVSLGCRGGTTSERVEDARRELLEWIEEREDLEVAGSLRTLGYNSPMVRERQRYFEVQIPVRRVEGS